MRHARQPGANSAAVRFCSNRANLDPVVIQFQIAAQQLWIVVDGIHDHVDVAIVIKVAKRRAPRRTRFRNARSRLKRHIREMPVVQVLIEQLTAARTQLRF